MAPLPHRQPGAAHRAGSVDVLDVDVRADGSGYPAFNRLKRAGLLVGYSRVVATPSGGLHVYFPGTEQPSSRLPAHHLDLKAAGGYVLVPPSVVDGHAYTLVSHRGGCGRRRRDPSLSLPTLLG